MSEKLYLVNGGWHHTQPKAIYSGRVAYDQKGNEYQQPANLETVTVRLAHNGKKYVAWTLGEAMDWAEKNMSVVPTREQVEKLKDNWCSDPCWDLWETQGYEAYRDELKRFQDTQELLWIMRDAKRLRETAERMGIPGNITLARYLGDLESRIRKIEDRLERGVTE